MFGQLPWPVSIMKKRVVIFGNGKLLPNFLEQIKPDDYIIGVDRAAYWLLTHGIIPNVAIGDFDSVTKEEMRLITNSIRIVKKFSSDKNWTDMELAVKFAIKQNPSEVVIVGGTGTRHDHTLATLHILDQLLKAGISHTFLDATNRIRLIGRGKTIIKKASYRYISILPYTKNILVSLHGFRYNLIRKILKQGTTIGISNELLTSQGVIRLFSGKAWVMESND